MPLQIRRGTEAERQALASTPQVGELIFITDTKQLYVGDGTNLLRDISPITGYTDENAVDAVGAILSGSSHSGITFSYNASDDAADRIVATVSQPSLLQNLNLNNFEITGTGNINIVGNLTVDGLLTADYKGSIYADDSTLLVNAVDGKIELDGTVKGDIIPDANEAYDIGSASNRFKDLYLSGTSLYLGSAQLTATGSIVNLPAGSTIGGVGIQTLLSGDTADIRDIQGSVFGDDSALLVDAVSSTIVGNVTNSTINTGVLNIDQDLAAGGLVINTQGSLDDDYDLFSINSYHDASVASGVSFYRARGTQAAPTSLNANDPIFSWLFSGQGASGPTPAAQITIGVDGALVNGGDDTPGSITFSTTDSTGVIRDALSIDKNQVINFADNTLQAGSASGEVDLSSSTTAESFLKVKVNGVEYALPLYLITP